MLTPFSEESPRLNTCRLDLSIQYLSVTSHRYNQLNMSCSFHNSILIIKQQLIQFLHRQTMASAMLSIQEKKTISIEIYRPLRQFIAFNYSEREAQNLEDDLQTLKNLRSDLERLSDSPDVRRDLLQTYYRVLCLVESRFPISPDKDHVNSITFTWYDSFKPKLKAAQQNIHLEKASVLFNLGSVYSQIGVSADRSSVNGLKLACNSFMASAGAFGFLKDNASLKASIGQSSITLDVSVECAAMLEKLMLAQAQECFFEKVISEGRTPGLSAKVSRQVGLFYEEAFAALNVPPLNQHFDRSWISHIQLKAALFYVEACYRYSLELHEKEEIADEIARIKCGISALVDAKKSMRGVSAKLVDIVNKLEANLNQNLDRAVKENDRVYLMRVPPPESLSPVPAYSLVKSMSMSEVLDASKEKMFASLIPDASAKALSRYTEMVDDIFRTQAEKLQQGSEITRVRLREMDLPDSILALEGNFSLPMDLKEDVEAVQICGGPSGLEAELQQLKDLTRVNHELLVQTEDILEKEAREDDQFRSQFGTRWTRPQSSNLTKKLLERLNRFAVNLKQAAESDARIERSMRDHSALMSILDHKPIESAIPTLARPIMSLDANEDAIVGALKQSLRQLENLGAQRAGLEDMLKEMKIKDDILPKLMISTGSYDDLFRKEIAKYDHICEEIAENIMAQEQLLLQIQAQNNDFAAMFNLEDYKASREKSYKQIAAAILKFREIKENIDEGMKFYVTLQDAITNVKQQSSDFVATRKMQCRETIDDVQRQVAGLSFQDGRSGYGSHNSNHAASLGQQHQTQSATQPQPQPQPQQHPHPQSHPQSQPQSHPQLQQPPHSQPPAQSHPYAQSQPRPQPQPHPQPPQASHTQPPYYQPTEQPTAAYVHPHPSYGSSPHQPPHYQLQASGNPYPPAQSQQPPHQYGQPPAYQGWPGQYYNAQNTQQPGYQPRPPHYNIPGPYPPHHQSGYYRQQ